ncbi:MAG: hypothetical protein EOL89_12525 [Actinobacteria bacterium]|nr:hypothetical protein [Actinomycetota bacterium]
MSNTALALLVLQPQSLDRLLELLLRSPGFVLLRAGLRGALGLARLPLLEFGLELLVLDPELLGLLSGLLDCLGGLVRLGLLIPLLSFRELLLGLQLDGHPDPPPPAAIRMPEPYCEACYRSASQQKSKGYVFHVGSRR